MSIALDLVDLTSAALNTKGFIDFKNVGISAGGVSANAAFIQNRPHISLKNNSGKGLFITFRTEAHSDHLDAGAWRVYDIVPGEAGIDWTVEYVMNATEPVSVLSTTYYFPGETVDNPGTLGNSPVGGTSTTTNIQTLQNDGNPLATQIIESTPTGAASSTISILNDGTVTIKGDVAGVLTTLLQLVPGATAGAASVLISDAARKTTILGTLEVDGTMFPNQIQAFGDLLMQTGTKIMMQQSGLGVNALSDTLSITQAGSRYDTHLRTPGGAGTGSIVWFEPEGTQVFKIPITGPEVLASKSLTFNGTGSISKIGFAAFTPGAGISTITHNFGFVPDVAIWSGGHAANVNPGTTTAAVYNLAANTCTINNFAAVDGFLLYLKA